MFAAHDQEERRPAFRKNAVKVIGAGLAVGLVGVGLFGSASTDAQATAGAAVESAAAVVRTNEYENDYGFTVWEHDKISGLEMVEIPEVQFTMGTKVDMATICHTGTWEDVEQHRVQLSSYSMSKTEITVAQYTEFLNLALEAGWVKVHKTTEAEDSWYWDANEEYELDTDFHFVVGGPRMGAYEGKYMMWLDQPRDEDMPPQNYNHIDYDEDTGVFSYDDTEVSEWPVVSVSWYGSYAFAQFYNMYLPTEAQWEYAAGGGAEENSTPYEARTMYPSASGTATTDEMNFNGDDMNRGSIEFPTSSMPSVDAPTPVCSYPENQRGFCDMGGNVYEWVYDWYDTNYYTSCSPGVMPECKETDGETFMINPHGPKGFEEPDATGLCDGDPFNDYTCNVRVRRGGALNYLSEHTCSFHRASGLPYRMLNHFGFRVVDTQGVEGKLSSGTR